METLKYHQNFRILVFLKRIKFCEEREHQSMYPPFGFSIQELSICHFHCQKIAFICEFQHIPLCKMTFFLKVPYVSWVWDSVDMYLTHLGTKIWSSSIHIYTKEWFSGRKTPLYPTDTREKLYFPNFEHYDLAIDKEWVCKIWCTCRHTS
jgi:hypothetical protein